MITESPLARAFLLYEQSRYDLALTETRRVLAADPDDATAHALLALCLMNQQNWSDAVREAGDAVRLGPANPYAFYAAGYVMLAAERLDQARAAADAAVRLDPADPNFHALVADVHMARRDWPAALAAAEQGLAFDPEHVQANNVRAMALVNLGRRAEAGATIGRALARDPEDAFTHANQGWALLHDRKPKEAMEHFREALRLDPTLDWARAGIVEALKAHNVVYQWMLAYFLFMSRLSARAQWALMLGGYFGSQLLRQLGEAHPAIAPYTTPVLFTYIGFVVLTWLSYPFFNLLLRLSRYGRLALSREQTATSNYIGAAIAAALAAGVAYWVSGAGFLLDVTIVLALLTLPLSGLFAVPKGWPRWVMGGAIGVLLAVGAVHAYRMFELAGWGDTFMKRDWEARQLLTVFGYGILITSIGANALGHARVAKG